MPWWAFPRASVPTSLLPCWLQTPPLWVKTQAAPTSELLPSLEVVARTAHDGGVAVRRQRDGDALLGVSDRAGADQLAALLVQTPSLRV